ncbi:hypothetical protein ACEPAF_8735 [Sanghuangporus sanghuang]
MASQNLKDVVPDRCSCVACKSRSREDEAFRTYTNRGRSTLAPCSTTCAIHRRILQLVGFAIAFLVLWILRTGLPPTYGGIREYERRLPQHNLSLPFPEGKDGMYLRFAEYAQDSTSGFSDMLQSLLLMSHLAYLSNRSFVFEDVRSSCTMLPYSFHDVVLRPTRIPLNAFISGPSAGGPVHVPRAVSTTYWDDVCPPSGVERLSSEMEVKIHDGAALVDWWVTKISSTSGHCVEIGSVPPVFSQFLLGSDRILSLWPSLADSPILRDFAWSPLVMSGVVRNLPLLTHPPTFLVPEVIEGLVVLHVPQGDYKRHCQQLSKWGKLYMGFNQFVELPDRLELPKFGSRKDPDAREKYYLQHCWPEMDGIAERLRSVRQENVHLRRVYVITDGRSWWVSRLGRVLAKDGWLVLKSGQDLQLDNEQKHVSTAIEMAIAERADVFVGNGFSTFSSNVVMLRTAKNVDPRSNRFW